MTDMEYYQTIAKTALSRYSFLTVSQLVRYVTIYNRVQKNRGDLALKKVDPLRIFHALRLLKNTAMYEFDNPFFKLKAVSRNSFCHFDENHLAKRLFSITAMLDIGENVEADLFDDFPTDRAPCELVFRTSDGLVYEIYAVFSSFCDLDNARSLVYFRHYREQCSINSRRIVLVDQEDLIPHVQEIFQDVYLFGIVVHDETGKNPYETIIYRKGDGCNGSGSRASAEDL